MTRTIALALLLAACTTDEPLPVGAVEANCATFDGGYRYTGAAQTCTIDLAGIDYAGEESGPYVVQPACEDCGSFLATTFAGGTRWAARGITWSGDEERLGLAVLLDTATLSECIWLRCAEIRPE